MIRSRSQFCLVSGDEMGLVCLLGNIPKDKLVDVAAFATVALEPLIIQIAIGRFKARFTTEKDQQEYKDAFKDVKSLGESAGIGLAIKNCGNHDLPLIKIGK